jgi:hypothetical protein
MSLLDRETVRRSHDTDGSSGFGERPCQVPRSCFPHPSALVSPPPTSRFPRTTSSPDHHHVRLTGVQGNRVRWNPCVSRDAQACDRSGRSKACPREIESALSGARQAYAPLVCLPAQHGLLPGLDVDNRLPAVRNKLIVEDTASDVGRVVEDASHLSRGPLLALAAKVSASLSSLAMRYWETPPSEYLWKMVLTIAASGVRDHICTIGPVREITERRRPPRKPLGPRETMVGTGVISLTSDSYSANAAMMWRNRRPWLVEVSMFI